MGNVAAAVAQGARRATGATAAFAAMERPSPVSKIPSIRGLARTFRSADVISRPYTSAGAASVFFGDVSGSGSFTGTGTTYFEGDLKPGSSPGQVSFGGNVVFGVMAGLEIQLAGDSSFDCDSLDVAGATALSGTLGIRLEDGYVPEPGTGFQIIGTGEEITGDFLSQTLSGAPDGLWMDRVVAGDSVSIIASAMPGDIDLDSVVGGLDAGVFRDHYGQETGATWFDGDFDHDGDVDFADAWALMENYSGPDGSEVSMEYLTGGSVPEPTMLVMLGLGGLCALRRRRQVGCPTCRRRAWSHSVRACSARPNRGGRGVSVARSMLFEQG